MTTKIVALTDGLGNLIRFMLLPGQHFETRAVLPLLEGLAFGALLADGAFDCDWLNEELRARGAEIVISQRSRRLKPLKIDRVKYRWRHLIENFFQKLKDFRRLAMRYEKTDTCFSAMIHACAGLINSR